MTLTDYFLSSEHHQPVLFVCLFEFLMCVCFLRFLTISFSPGGRKQQRRVFLSSAGLEMFSMHDTANDDALVGRSDGQNLKNFVLMRQPAVSNVCIPSSEIDTDIDRPSRWLIYTCSSIRLAYSFFAWRSLSFFLSSRSSQIVSHQLHIHVGHASFSIFLFSLSFSLLPCIHQKLSRGLGDVRDRRMRAERLRITVELHTVAVPFSSINSEMMEGKRKSRHDDTCFTDWARGNFTPSR